MSDKGFWSRIFGGSPNDEMPTHSFEELQRIHNVLLDPANQVVNAFNKSTLIETLRELAELLIWGDQNDARVFEYFLEHNMLKHYKRILAVPSHRRGDVAVQLLQTLSILITNISKQTSMFFLFSNNHLNDIIGLGFDLRDEEVLAHFITLLKTISFKLDRDTIQFFFQVDSNNRATFPLYNEARKLFNHSEGMVRAAVRMLTINVYSVGDPSMLDYVASAPCNHYFHEVALHLADHALHFDRHLDALQSGRSSVLKDMDHTMTEMEDYLSYVGDVIEVANPRLRSEVSRKFWDGFVEPIVVGPLLAANAAEGSAAGVGSPNPAGAVTIKPCTALYSVERIFAQLRAPSMLEAVACTLLAGPAAAVPRPPVTTAEAASAAIAGVEGSGAVPGDGDGTPAGLAADTSSRRLNSSQSLGSARSLSASGGGARFLRCREAVLGCLRGRDAAAAAAAVRTLAAAAAARLPSELAAALGLALDPSGDAATAGLAPVSAALTGPLEDVSGPLPEASSSRLLSPQTSIAFSTSMGISAALSLNSDIVVDDLVRAVVSNRMRPATDDATQRLAAAHRTEVSDALLMLLQREDVAPAAGAAAAWLLGRVLPPAEGGGVAVPPSAATALRSTTAAARAALLRDARGVWADALLPLAALEWARLRPITVQGTLRCYTSDLLQFLIPPTRTRPHSTRPLDPSAVAAISALSTVSRSCLLSQLHEALHTGAVAAAPPVPRFNNEASTLTEGALVSMSQAPAHPCRVSFRRGEERSALLTVLSPKIKGQPLATVSPHATLLSPAINTVSAGHVLSAAPLLATLPESHDQHRKWLKASVRPTVTMLLEAIQAARQQGMPFSLSSKAYQLGDGVWVLALESEEAVDDVTTALKDAHTAFVDSVVEVIAPLATPAVPLVNGAKHDAAADDDIATTEGSNHAEAANGLAGKQSASGKDSR